MGLLHPYLSKLYHFDMNCDLEVFNDFVDDLLSSDENLLRYELDFLLMQYLFQSIDLELLKKIDSNKVNFIAS